MVKIWHLLIIYDILNKSHTLSLVLDTSISCFSCSFAAIGFSDEPSPTESGSFLSSDSNSFAAYKIHKNTVTNLKRNVENSKTQLNQCQQIYTKKIDYLLEALDSFANAAAHFRQFLGSKNEGCHAGNNHEFGYAQSKQGVASETLVSSATLNGYYSCWIEQLRGAITRRRRGTQINSGCCCCCCPWSWDWTRKRNAARHHHHLHLLLFSFSSLCG